MASPARNTGAQVAHCFVKTLNFNTPFASTALEVGTIPANSVIISGGVTVKTAFNAATSNVIDVGYATDPLGAGNANAYTNSIPAGTTGTKFFDALGAAAALPRAYDTTIVAVYTQTGTAATAGAAEIFVIYLPKN